MKLLKWQQKYYNKAMNGDSFSLQVPTGAGKGILGAEIVKNATKTAIIVCPPHLIDDWTLKLENAGVKKQLHIVDKKHKYFDKDLINIISYNKLALYVKEIKSSLDELGNNVLWIFDEAHKLKSWTTKTYKAIRSFNKNHYYQNILFSATLIVSDNLPFYTYATLTSKGFSLKYPSFYRFQTSGAVLTNRIFLGTRTVDRPIRILEPYLHLVTNNFYNVEVEVGTKPEFIEVKVPSNKRLISIFKELDSKTFKLQDNLNAKAITRHLNTLANPHSKYLQLANNFMYDIETNEPIYFNYNKKLYIVKSIIKTEKEAEHKGVLMYFFSAELDKLKATFKSNGFFFNSNKSVQQQIEEFEAGDKDIFIVNVASLGEGVRFKNTDYLIKFTTIWDYGRVIQSEGRLNYQGRDKAYRIYSLVTDNKYLSYINNGVKNMVKKAKQISGEYNG